MVTNAIPLADTYRKQAGRVSFLVSSFGNLASGASAQELILRMLEAKVLQEATGNLSTDSNTEMED